MAQKPYDIYTYHCAVPFKNGKTKHRTTPNTTKYTHEPLLLKSKLVLSVKGKFRGGVGRMNKAGSVRNNNYKVTGPHGARLVQSDPACMSTSVYSGVYTKVARGYF